MTRRQAVLLRGFSVWTTYIWIVLIYNIARDHTKGHDTFGFKAVHFMLAAISLSLAVASWRVVTRIAGKRAVFPRRGKATARVARGTAPEVVPEKADLPR